MLRLGLRLAARSIVLSRTSVLARYPLAHYDGVRHPAFRTFSTTPRRSAEEAHDEFINAIKHTSLFQKLADKPNAIKALSDFYALTKDMGIDITSLDRLQMYKLATNRRFLKAVKRVMNELNEAGLKLDSEDAVQEILGLTKGNLHKKDGS